MTRVEHLLPDDYKLITALHEEHNVYLVQHIPSEKMRVFKIMDVYDSEVFLSLANDPVIHIPQIYYISEREDCLLLIEDYISGTTLQQMLDVGKTFSETEVIEIMLPLCDTVDALHEKQPPIIHRDIKPSNIMITPDGIPWLLDLNAARLDSREDEEDTRLLGTKGFAAPEQYGFGTSNATTDIYALGMVMNTLLTGKVSRSEVARGALSEIITCCLQIERSERYKDARHLRKAILKAKHPLGIDLSNVAPYLPPGFRSGNIVHMVIAALSYIFIVYGSFTFDFVTNEGVRMFAPCLTLAAGTIAVIFFTFNYRDWQRILAFIPRKRKTLRILGIVLADIIIFTVVFFFLGIILAIIFDLQSL